MKELEIFKLEERVLFEAAAAAEVVDAVEKAQENPNANISESERSEKENRDALKNAPAENPAAQQSEGNSQALPEEISDVDAALSHLIEGVVPAGENTLDADENGMVDAVVEDKGVTLSTGKELVVINSTVADKEVIFAELKPNQEVLVLEEGSGLDELNEFLDESDTKYSAIHFITHGNDGYISVNGELIDAENFNAAPWQEIGEHLTADADILIYGCDTAADAEGKLLVEMISEASGADVSASTDATGISGNWELEYTIGSVDTAAITVENFEHNLTNYTVTNLNDSGAGSLRQAVLDANANTGTDEITFAVDGTIYIKSRITVTESLVIKGNGTGETILSGGDQYEGLYLNNIASFTAKDLTFTDFTRAVYANRSTANSMTIAFENVNFLNNVSSTYEGSAFAVDGLASNLTVNFTNTLFDWNVSQGGAISVKTSAGAYSPSAACDLWTINIQNSKFTTNSTSTSKGGAISTSRSYGGDTVFNISDSVFEGNSAGTGGAIYASGVSSGHISLNISNTVFKGNEAANTGGGAIYMYPVGGSLIANNTIFAQNKSAGGGGALSLNTVNSRIFNSVFTENESVSSGSSIYYIGYNTDLTLVNNVFMGNTGYQSQSIKTAGTLEFNSVNNIILGENIQTSSANKNVNNLTDANATVAGTFDNVISGVAQPDDDGYFYLKEGGSADGKGVYVWHNADYSAIAYSTTATGTKTAIVGTASAATLQLDNFNSAGKPNIGSGKTAEAASLEVTTTEDVINAYDNLTSLREAVAYAASNSSLAIDGKYTITFAEEIFTDNSAVIPLKSSLSVGNTIFTESYGSLEIVVDSGKTVILDGNNSVQIMKLDYENIVSIAGLTFRKGYASGYNYGGAIQSNADLTLQNCVFTQNTYSGDVGGGAIHSFGNFSNIKDSVFTENSSTASGGAILGANLTLVNTKFIDNSASLSGGAVHIINAASVINNCSFQNNSAASGGAISTAVALSVKDSSFTGNHASSRGGGAISTSTGNGKLDVENSTFEQNYAVTGGGAISAQAKLSIADSVFSGNYIQNISSSATAYGRGGAVWGSDETIITNSLFSENYAYVQGTAAGSNIANATATGGAVYGADKLVVDNSTFTGNYTVARVSDSYIGQVNSVVAWSKGGAVFSYQDVIVTNSSFVNNEAQVSLATGTSRLAVRGGAAVGAEENIYAVNSVFVNNKGIQSYNGSISSGNASLLAKNLDIYHSIYDFASVSGTLTGSGNSVDKVSASEIFAELDADGKAILNADGTVHIKTGGSAHGKGVFVWHNEDYSALAYSETINGEKTAVIGGVDAATILIATDQLGETRTAPTSIGASHLAAAEESSLVVTTTSDVVDAYDNLTSLREAIAYAESQAGADEITFDVDGTFYLDSAITISSELTITGKGKDVTIFDGMGEDRLFVINSGAIVKISNATLQNGFAAYTAHGGAIYNKGTLTVSDTCFTGNKTEYQAGGAIYNSSTGALSVFNTTFSGNRVGSSGGAIYNYGGAALIVNSTFAENKASGYGGAIYNVNNTVKIFNSTFSGNTATQGGDALFFNEYGGSVLINNIIINNDIEGTISRDINNLYSNATVAETFEQVSYGKAVLNADGTFHIKSDGKAHGKGVFIWHNEDYTAVAYSQTIDGAKTVVYGEINEDDTWIATDQLGQTRTAPTSIGAYHLAAAEKASLVVTTTSDVVDAYDNVISLREALAYAASNSFLAVDGKYTITFDIDQESPVITLDGSALTFDSGLSGKILVIDGTNTSSYGGTVTVRTPVQGTSYNSTAEYYLIAGSDSNFYVFSLNAAQNTQWDITFSNLSIYGGNTSALCFTGAGAKQIALDNVSVYRSGYAALYVSGGGDASSLSVTDSHFEGNKGAIISFVNTIIDNTTAFKNIEADVITVANKAVISNSEISDSRANSSEAYYALKLTGDTGATVDNVEISNNRNVSYGTFSGIFATSKFLTTASATTVQIRDSYVHDNSGYGISLQRTDYSSSSSSTDAVRFEVTGTTVANNERGGITAGSGYGNKIILNVINSTIFNNTYASGSGGGIFMLGGSSTLNLINSTVTGNTAQDGGGIFVNSRISSNFIPGYINLLNSIVTGNTATESGKTKDITLWAEGGGITAAYSIYGYADEKVNNVNNTSSQVISAVTAFGTTPVLKDNGGATPTIAITQTAAAAGKGGYAVSYSNAEGGIIGWGYAADKNATPAQMTGSTGTAELILTDQLGETRTAPSSIGAYHLAIAEKSSLVVTTTSDVVDAYDNFTSLREAITYANSKEGADEITFAVDGTIKFNSEITISSDITITCNGTDKIIFDGQAQTRFFTVRSGVEVELSNITFQNGYSASNGGAIYNSGTLIISNSTFTENSADAISSGHGGAIYNSGNGTLTISNSTFTGNSANWYGGAIDNDGTLTISDSTFKGNSADWFGGAIYNDDSGTLTISNSTFTRNSAGSYGGAICNSGSALTISNSTFTGNSASDGGGAIRNVGTLTISNSTFTGNSAVSRGGAIYNLSGTLTISDSTFKENSAGHTGGAIDNSGISGTLTITDSTFTENSANGGGAILNWDGGTLTIINSTFTGNSAGVSGGAIDNDSDGTLNLVNNIFVGNGSSKSQEIDGTIAVDINNIYTSADVTVANTFAELDAEGKAILNADGTVHIKGAGKVHGTGVFVWHNEDYSALAYSETINGEKTAVIGSVDAATILIATDQLGQARTSPTDIGAVIADQKLITLDPNSSDFNCTITAQEYDGTKEVDNATLKVTVNGVEVELGWSSALFNSANVKEVSSATFSGLVSLNPAYVLNTDTITVDARGKITAKDITVTANAQSKTYGDADGALTYQVSDLVDGDSLSGNLERVAGENVGTYAIKLGSLGNSNYSITYVGANFTITKRDLAITATNISNHAYGTDYVLDYTSSALGTGDTFTGSLTIDPSDSDKSQSGNYNVGSHTITMGTLDIVDEYGVDKSDNYIIHFTSGTLEIVKALIQVTAVGVSDKVYDGTTSGTLSSWSFNSAVASSDALELSGSAQFDDKHAGSGKSVSVNNFILSGADAGNYTLLTDTITATANISQASIEIKANDSGKGYGASDPELSYTILSGELYGSDSLNLIRVGGENVGSYAIDQYVINDGNGGNNYTVDFTAGEFVIGAKSAAIIVGTTELDYNGTHQDATEYTISGLESGDFVYSIDLEGARNAGTHTVTVESVIIHDAAGNDVTANYGLSYQSGQLIINRADIVVTATAETITYGETAASAYTYSGSLYGSDAFSGTLSINGAMNSQETLYAAGTAQFERGSLAVDDGNGGNNYNVTFNSASLTIKAKEISLSAVEIQNKTYDGTTAASVLSAQLSEMISGDNLSAAISGAEASFVSKNAGENVTVNASGFTLEGADKGNYILESDSFVTSADISKANLVIYTHDISKVYGDADPGFTYSADGLKGGDTISDLGRSNKGTNVGNYEIDLFTLNDGNNGNNYNVTLHKGTLTITAKGITITATNISNHAYGTDYVLDYTSSALCQGDKFTGSLTIDLADNDKSQSGNYNVGSHTITMGTLDIVDEYGVDMSDNYTIRFNTGTLDIVKVTIQVASVGVEDKVYDGTTSGTLASWTFNNGVANSDALELSGSVQFDNKHAGSGKSVSVNNFILSGADAGNYTLLTDTITATANISKASIEIKANDSGKGYGASDPELSYTILSGELYGSDSLNLIRAGGENVGSYAIDQYVINDGNGGNNYTVDFTGGTFTIGAKSAEITVGTTTVDYNGTLQDATEYTISGLEGGDFVYSIDLEGSRNAGTHTVTVESVIIHDAGGNDVTANYGLSYQSGQLIINQANLVVNAAAETITYGDSAVGAYTYTGTLYTGDVLTGSMSINGAMNSQGTLYAAGTAQFERGSLAVDDGNGGNNYNVTFNSASLTIKAKEISLSAVEIQNKVYDGTTAASVLNAQVSAMISGDKLSVVTSGAEASFVSKNADENVAVNASGFTLGGADKGNYILKSDSFVTSADISKADLSIYTKNISKVYGDADPVFTYSANGLKSGDSITDLGRSNKGTNVGNYEIDLFTLNDGNNGNNYNVTLHKGTLTITAKDITITATNISNHAYGTDYVLAYTSSTLGTGDKFIGSLTIDPSDSDKSQSGNYNVGSHTITMGTLDIVDEYGVDMSDNYTIRFNTGTLEIVKAEIQIAGVGVSDKVYDGTTSGTLSSWSFNNAVANSDALELSGSVQFDNKHAGSAKSVSVNNFILSGADAENYTLLTDTITATSNISRASIEIKANDAGKTYGASDPVLDYTLLSGALYGSDSLSLIRAAGENAGTYSINSYLLSDGNNGGNYDVRFTAGEFVIGTKSAAIIVGTTELDYNGTHQDATEYTISGLEGGDFVYSIDLEGARNAGTHTVTVESVIIHDAAGNDVTANYGLSYQSGQLIINQANLVINAAAETITYGDSAVGTYTYTGTLYTGDVLTGSMSINGAMNSQGTLYAAGTAQFERGSLAVDDGNGGNNYNVTFNSASLTIKAKEISLSAVEIQNKAYDGTTAASVLSAQVSAMIFGDNLSVVISGAEASFVSKNAGENVAVNASGFTLDGADKGNYILKSDSFVTSADISKADLSIYTQNISKVYGDADPVFTYSANGLKSGDSITDLGRSNNGTNVGNYEIDLFTLNDGNNGNNYNVTLHKGTLTITPKNITVTANAQSKAYGEADPELTYKVSGLVGSDTMSGALTRVAGENAGTYAITQGTLTAGANYSISFTEGTLSIKEASSLIVTTTSDTVDSYDGVTSLREAVAYAESKAGADEITFAVDGTIKFNSEITISSDITITYNGTDKIIFDGQAQTRFFTVNSDTEVELSNITFQNGYSGDDGGAIFNSGTLTISDSTFTGNSADDGGAIYNFGTLTISNSTFTGNSANWSGGAIYSDGTLTISNSTFTGNSANYGGAIESDGTLTISNSTFTGNTANYGGAIYNYYSGTLTISDSTFTGNTANSGGAIFNYYSGSLTISDSTFTENSADSSGGAIHNEFGTLTISDSTFTGNSASSGGAIDNSGTLTVTDSTFTENSASSGGAIHNEFGTLTVTDSTFTENSAASLGGAIYSYGTLTISNSTFTGNSANSGGAIYNTGTLTISNSTFTENSASFGGAIYHSASNTLTITDSTFTGNSASIGGAICNSNSDTLTISDSTFTGNRADEEGGAIYNYFGTLTVSDSTFTGNSADAYSGGAIYNSDSSTLTISDSTFTGNSADSFGGAICNSGTLTISDSTFTGNSTNWEGGAIYNSGSLTISDSTFTGNSASSGGAIYNYFGTLTISNSTFTGNSSDSFGGAICNSGSLTISDSTFTGNSTNWEGGAIYNSGSLTISDSTFTENSADSAGGAIYNYYSGSLTISNSTFTGNSADEEGGAIYNYNYNSGTLNLVNNIFVGNGSSKTQEIDGTIAVDINNIYTSDDVTVANTFAELDADGKAILNADGTVHIKGAGKAHGTGVFVWHNEDYSALAYSKTINGEKTAVIGSVDAATILISTDQLGQTRTSPTDIGAVIADQKLITLDPNSSDFNCTITAQEYDGTIEVDNATLKVMVDGVEVELGWSSALFNSANVKDVTTATFSGLVSLNPAYVLNTDTITVDAKGKITAKAVTVTANAQSKTYGEADAALTYQVSGLVGNDVLGGNLERVAGENVGTYAIGQGSLANSNYNITYVGADLKITAKDITVTADAQSKTYGDADAALTYQVSGLIGSDTLTGNLERVAGENVGTYAIKLGSLGNSNYNITYVGANLTISAKDITVTADAQTKTYGDADAALTYQVSGLIGSDTLTGNLERFAGENVGTYAIKLGSLGNSNYSITYVGADLTITAKDITVTADVQSKTYGDADSALTYQVTGLVGNDSLNGTLERVAGENVGTYAIKLGSLGNSNYSITYVGANLTISAKDITVTADAQSKTYGDADAALTYQVTGLVGNDSLNGTLERVAGENVGTYAIGQGSLANSNYNITYVGVNLTITAKDITVTADAQSKTYGEADSALTYQVSGLVGNDVLGGNLERVAGENVGTYAIGQGSLANSNYNITYVGANLTITTKDITVTADAQSKTYGDADAALTYQVSGLVGSDTLTGALTREVGENVGTYAIGQGSLGNSNYNITYVGANLTITARELTIDPADLVWSINSQVYDGDTAVDSASISVNGITLSWSDAHFDSADVADVSSATFRGLSAGSNYKLSFDTVTLAADGKILAKEITVAADHKSKFFGSADPALTYTAIGLVGKDALSGSLIREPGESVGTYAIKQGTLSSGSNYNINFTEGKFAIVYSSGHVADSETTAAQESIRGALLYNGGNGTFKGGIYSMGYAEIISAELKRSDLNTANSPFSGGQKIDLLRDKFMTVDNIVPSLSIRSKDTLHASENFAAGRELTIETPKAENLFSFCDRVKLPSSFFGQDDELAQVLTGEYDIPVAESVDVFKVDAVKTEIEKLIDEMLVQG